MHTLILQAIQSLHTNSAARPTSIRPSISLTPENSSRKRVMNRANLGRVLYGMRRFMDVGRGYGGAYSSGGSG